MSNLIIIDKVVNSTKKEVLLLAELTAVELLNDGITDNIEAIGSLTKLKDYCETLLSRLKDSEAEDFLQKNGKSITKSGVSFTFSEGRKSLNYNEDSTYVEISKMLKDRKEILDLSKKVKEPIYDGNGNEVPKVNEIYSKSYLTVKY